MDFRFFEPFVSFKLMCAVVVWLLVNYLLRWVLKKKVSGDIFNIKDVNVNLNGVQYPVSYWTDIGIRKYQEDRFVCAIPNANTKSPKLKQKENCERLLMPCLYGIFDGHGGTIAADFCKDHLPEFLLYEELNDVVNGHAKKAFAAAIKR